MQAELSQQQRTDASSAWGFFGSVFCITLKGREDRRRTAEAEFARVGLGGIVKFLTVDKHPTDAEEGIFNSHLECLRNGLAAGGNVLVFEDDVVFHRFSLEALSRAIAFMRTDPDWQIFFFGAFVNSSCKTPFPSVLRVKFRCLAHAYVVKRQFAERIISQTWTGVAYDDLLRQLIDPGCAYALYPAFAFQSGSATDNNMTPVIDRMRRLLGGVRRLQRWNEFCNRHFTALIAAHVIAAIIVVLILLFHFS